eukprot:5308213-Amphidinium_carterae.1
MKLGMAPVEASWVLIAHLTIIYEKLCADKANKQGHKLQGTRCFVLTRWLPRAWQMVHVGSATPSP